MLPYFQVNELPVLNDSLYDENEKYQPLMRWLRAFILRVAKLAIRYCKRNGPAATAPSLYRHLENAS
jgi:hypothetical protein